MEIYCKGIWNHVQAHFVPLLCNKTQTSRRRGNSCLLDFYSDMYALLGALQSANPIVTLQSITIENEI